MSDSMNQLFVKVIAVNLIVVGVFAVVSPLVAIYLKKYDDKQQLTKILVYLAGGVMLIIIGVLIYK